MMDTMNDNDPTYVEGARVDAAIERMRANTRTFLTSPCDYTLTGYSETPSRNGVSWSGIIRKNGVEVGRVSDDGVGGMVAFGWLGTEYGNAFVAEAKARYGDGPNASDDFAGDLATAAQYNRKRSVLVITDDQDLSMGECLVLKPGTSLATVKAVLTNPTGQFAGKNPMVWDKSQSMFVPAAEIEG